MDQLPPKSDPGYADALYNLAERYYWGGDGLAEDDEKAFRLWKEAAEMDHIDSMYRLGDCYEDGDGCEIDLDLAFYWHKKAAEKDYLNSIYKLGQDMDQLPPKSDPGYADALYNLAWRYWYGEDGLEEDEEKALCLWKEAAEMDHVDAMHELGRCYFNGRGCEEDGEKAIRLWKEAAEMDHVDSMKWLGDCYKYGWGCEKREETAFAWCEKAAQRDHVKSMIKLGACYKLGRGCQQDSDLALEWWEKVAQQEDGPDELYKHGLEMIDNDYTVGYGCLSTALKHGHKEALAYLLYYHQQSDHHGTVDEKIQQLRKIEDEDPSDFVAVFLLAERLSNSFNLKDLDEATSLLATIPQDVTIYARSQWLVPFLEEKKNIIYLSAQSGQSFPTESDYMDPRELEIVALIGEGQFGKVYLAKYAYSRWVAVKYLNDNEFREHEDAVNKLMRERLVNQILKASHSRNTAKYMGIVTDFKNNKSGLVFELCADLSLVLEDAEDRINKRSCVGGPNWRKGESNFDSLPDWRSRVPSSLRSAVVFARATTFSTSQLLEIIRNVAIALQCLHILGILHRDIADRNVLCDGEGNVQLADFGMSCFVGVGTDFEDEAMLEYSHELTEGNQYAIAWWPPECLGEEPIFSFASDVYSFFIMVWQCLAREDPFQSLLDGDGDPFVRVAAAILNGQRPNLNKLRKDTPDRLRNLIEDAWADDPLSRPTLPQVISELGEILDEVNQKPENKRVVRRRRGNKVERRWFDVKNMYLTMSTVELVEEALKGGNGSFEASFLQRQVAKNLEKAPSMTVLGESTIRLLGGRRPYDVFIAHAGEQKFTEASSLKRILELAGFRCFLDRKMKNIHGSPVDQMAFALETCRYVVVILSKVFLTKSCPCKELQNALDRAQWLEGSSSSRLPFQSWRSLHVILLDLSVKEYAAAQADEGRPSKDFPPLPALGQFVVMKEYANGQGKIEDWPTASEELGDELLSHDKKEGAVDRWNVFLQGWDSLSERGFPWADTVYHD